MQIGKGDTLIIERLTGKEVLLRKEPSYHDLIGTIPTQKEDPVVRIRKLRDAWKQ